MHPVPNAPTCCRRGKWLALGPLLAWLVFAPLGQETHAAEQRRPNLLFMFTDDQPQICMGAMGNPHIQTPNMDRLAADGVLFTNAFVTTAICCSNRACILTGQHMRRHGIEDFHTPLAAEALDQTYPMLLREAGYRTGYLGKFAVGWPEPEIRHLSLPAEEFDFWYGFPQTINFLQEIDGQKRYLTDVMTEKAVQFLRTNPPGKPFCLTIAFKEPHGPWNFFDPDVPDAYADAEIPPPPTFSEEAYDAQPPFIRDSLNGGTGPRWLKDPDAYQKHVRTFYRLITRVDIAVGEILAELERLGLDENTVILYSSDHGSLLGAHGLAGKWLMYEESIRVPLVIRDPRQPRSLRGRRCEEMALSIDLAPTMLTLAGVPVPERMQGRSLEPLVAGQDVDWRDDWYYEHVYNTRPPRRPIVKCEGVRTDRWKYTRYPEIEPPYEQLFDLDHDPREEKNLAHAEAHADVLSRLRNRCDEYRETLR
jgi:arylsulfatase A-like enzyme